MGVQVVVTDYHGAGVTSVQVFQQLSHRSFLLGRSRVGGLTADIQPTLIAYADGVAVVIDAMGTDHPFRTPCLYRSVTTDDVVVADTELETSLTMPRVYLSCRTLLVGAYRTTMNNNQCNSPHDCTNTVELIAVRIVMTICTICFHVSFFIPHLSFVIYHLEKSASTLFALTLRHHLRRCSW